MTRQKLMHSLESPSIHNLTSQQIMSDSILIGLPGAMPDANALRAARRQLAIAQATGKFITTTHANTTIGTGFHPSMQSETERVAIELFPALWTVHGAMTGEYQLTGQLRTDLVTARVLAEHRPQCHEAEVTLGNGCCNVKGCPMVVFQMAVLAALRQIHQEPGHCVACGSVPDLPRECSCGVVYCDVNCQKTDWKNGHVGECT